ncbi:hypothetical protein L2E82_42448 [Cichorium intybus]|uniref:Uncharacterized protein n=1 Tax=Cichorium intybus TaxID=13427 RepID=A0ACB8ZM10_CICIN|nr:hypothetical protein L2E82_42448 [Cichorium intybus]
MVGNIDANGGEGSTSHPPSIPPLSPLSPLPSSVTASHDIPVGHFGTGEGIICPPTVKTSIIACNGSENENTVGDFIHLNNENPSQPDNHNADVVTIAEGIEANNITGTTDDVVVSDFVNPKTQELKKQLKATLLNSPTSIRIKTEVSDNSDIKKVKPQVVVEENEKKAVENDKAKSLNNSRSLGQLKKQLKAILIKYNMDANKDDEVNIL